MPDDEGRPQPVQTAFRACEACRVQKIRCHPADDLAAQDPANPPSISGRPPCRRCRDLGRACVYTEPRRTKRKRIDARVRELEREVRELGELLLLQRQHQEGGGQLRQAEAEGGGGDSGGGGGGVGGGDSGGGDSSSGSRSVVEIVGEAAPAPVTRDPLDVSPGPSLDGPPVQSPGSSASKADPVAAGLLSMERAVQLFRRYVLDMAPQRPFVVFPSVVAQDDILTATGWLADPDLDRKIAEAAAHVRANTPVLFLSILAAAVGTGVSDEDRHRRHPGEADTGADLDALGSALDSLLLSMYAEDIIVGGHKTVELIQALLVSSNWNFYNISPSVFGSASTPTPVLGHGSAGSATPAKRNYYDHLRFYQHLHLAASMAIEIGPSLYEDERCPDAHADDPLGFKRTLLSCYICCSSVSLGFHRQTMFSFTPYIGDCLEALQSSPHAARSDEVLVAWVRLQRIVDMTASALGLRSFGMETEPQAAVARRSKAHNLSDPGTQLNLRNAVRQLEEWNKSVSGTCMNNSLLMQYHTILALLHEASLYDEFDPADFKPPYRLTIPPTPDPSSQSNQPRPLLTPFHLTSRRTCLMASRNLLGIFLASPTDQLLGSPVVVYARIGYALVVLIKLQISAAMPGGAMHGLILDTAEDSSATLVRLYIARLIDRLRELHQRHCRIASAWLSVVMAINEWYETYFVPAAGGVPLPTRSSTMAADGDASSASTLPLCPVFEPLRHCSILGDGQQLAPSPRGPGQSSTASAAATRKRPSPAIQGDWFTPDLRGSKAPQRERAAAAASSTEWRAGNVPTTIAPNQPVPDIPEEISNPAPAETGNANHRFSDEEMLDSILGSNDMSHWLDPRVDFGDIVNSMIGMATDQTPL